MTFRVEGPCWVALEGLDGGYLDVPLQQVETWTEEEGVWRGSPVTFPRVDGLGWGNVVGYCVLDAQQMKLGSVRFSDGNWQARR